jgi:hypothetical protein
VDVCARQGDRDRNAPAIGEDVTMLVVIEQRFNVHHLEHACRGPLAKPPVARAAAAEFRWNRIPLTTRTQAIQDATHRAPISDAWTATLFALAAFRNPNLNPIPKLVGYLGK